MECRTATLGGHTDRCEACGYTRQSYNSCRNRHCPKCQLIKTAQWVDKVASNLPPVPHFHIVFTIPSCLYPLFYINQRVAYGLLFKSGRKSFVAMCQSIKIPGSIGRGRCPFAYLGPNSGISSAHSHDGTFGRTFGRYD